MRESGIEPILEWDILMTQDKFEFALTELAKIDMDQFKSIRVQDPGAISHIIANYPKHKIQLILESGAFHNKTSINTMIDMVGPQLERLILSLELPRDTLEEYINNLDVETEFLGIGRILLFYTPRSLVKPLFDNDISQSLTESPLEIEASSEESPHKGFPVVENMHGTFMFNTKDHFVLEYVKELREMGLNYLRIDLRFEQDYRLLEDISFLIDSFSDELVTKIKNEYPHTVIRGFFHKNKSDVLFKKLKNYRVARNDENFIGDVVEVNKGNHLGIMLRSVNNGIKIDDKIKLLTPDGKTKSVAVKSIKNSSHEELPSAAKGQIIFIPHVSGISVRTTVYLDK